ncbi:MAG: TIGR03905 family TSCPD domain-containing protein [Oscillospiraceae bacterium]
MFLKYKTRGTCSRQINIELEEDIIKNVEFVGGCNGNGQGVSKLVTGKNVYEVIKTLKGISCNGKSTSCPDQLSIALEQMTNM